MNGKHNMVSGGYLGRAEHAKTSGIGGDIFKNGPSPELQAEWSRLENLEHAYWQSARNVRLGMLERHPELRNLVTCEACRQELPEPVEKLAPMTELEQWLRRQADSGPQMWAQPALLAANAVEQLQRHEQQGGITMKCGHPVQCAYPDDGGGCSMCDLTKKVAELEETVAGEFDTGPFGRDAITGPEPGPCYCGANPGCCSCSAEPVCSCGNPACSGVHCECGAKPNHHPATCPTRR